MMKRLKQGRRLMLSLCHWLYPVPCIFGKVILIYQFEECSAAIRRYKMMQLSSESLHLKGKRQVLLGWMMAITTVIAFRYFIIPQREKGRRKKVKCLCHCDRAFIVFTFSFLDSKCV